MKKMKQKTLKSILEERKITPYRLAKDCGIATSDIYQALSGKKPMFPKWRKVIAEYLKMDECQLFERRDENADNVTN